MINVPAGSGNWAGFQIRAVSPLNVPEGWIVQRGTSDEYGAIALPVGTVASVYSPESYRPLDWQR